MNKSFLKINIFAVFISVLSACSSFNQSESFDNENPFFVSNEDIIADFRKGETGSFYSADGYSNGDPFDCAWSRNAIAIKDQELSIKLYEENDKIYGGEYRSMSRDFHYGYYATRMKPADCSGVISSFFTYTYSPAWDEIDIEFLGKDMTSVQFNYYTKGVGGHEFVYKLSFDASKEFHEYGFEWLPDSITWYVDGNKVHRATENIPTEPQSLMMNLWNCKGKNNWSGTFDKSKLPVQSHYEFIAYIPAESAD